MKHKIIKVLLVASICILESCDSSRNFYCRSTDGDLNIIPLVYPYQLVTNLIESDSILYPSWQMNIGDNDLLAKDQSIKYLRASHINVIDSVVFGGDAEPALSDGSNTWFIVNLKTNYNKEFMTRKGWENALKGMNVETHTLYRAWEVYGEFKVTKKLPWSNSSTTCK